MTFNVYVGLVLSVWYLISESIRQNHFCGVGPILDTNTYDEPVQVV